MINHDYSRDNTFYTTLVKVLSINSQVVELLISDYHYNEIVLIDIKEIPIMFYGVLLDDPTMIAHVNLGAFRKGDLIIKDYRLF